MTFLAKLPYEFNPPHVMVVLKGLYSSYACIHALSLGFYSPSIASVHLSIVPYGYNDRIILSVN